MVTVVSEVAGNLSPLVALFCFVLVVLTFFAAVSRLRGSVQLVVC